MAGLSTGLKKKLTITACTLGTDGNLPLQSGKDNVFEVMLNPSGFSHQHSISYSQTGKESKRCKNKKPLGQSGAEPKFDAVSPETVKFDLVIDGTGVVNLPIPGVMGSPPVKDQIDHLKKVAYDYQGKNHEPNICQLVWGDFSIYGRLESMSVEYTLFKPSGKPLRAKVGLSFIRYMSKKEQALRANTSSPDLTHLVAVQAGDTLPLLCYRIYKDCSYYLDVAKRNNIDNFRDIKPGTILSFPPLS